MVAVVGEGERCFDADKCWREKEEGVCRREEKEVGEKYLERGLKNEKKRM